MSLIDICSHECMKSELDLFGVEGTQTAIEDTRVEDFYPLTSLDGDGQIEFKVNVASDEFIDLNCVFLHTKCRIIDEDGSALKEKDKDGTALAGSIVFPVNYLQGAMFKQVEILLNNTLVQTGSLYPYRSYMETLLSFSKEVKEHQLKCGMYYEDTGEWDNVDPAAGKNKGIVSRFERTRYSKLFECQGRIHLALFQQSKDLLNKVTLGLRFHRNTPKFMFISKEGKKNYRLNIEQAKLLVTIKRVAAHAREAIETKLLELSVKYNLRRVEMRFFTRASDRSDISINNLCNGVLPSLIIVGMVNTNSFNGALKANPFNFQHFNAIEFGLLKNGVNVPFKPLTLNFADGTDTLMAYFQLMHSIGYYTRNKSNGIDPFGNYLNGCTLFGVNLSQDFSNGGNLNLIQEGLISLNLRLSEGKNHSITIIVYLVYPSTILEINQNREILLNE